MMLGQTYEKRKKMKIAPKITRPRTSQRAQLFQVLRLLHILRLYLS